MKKALMVASVASMIDLFNMENIKILLKLGYKVDVLCNFQNGSITSDQRVKEFKSELADMGIGIIDCPIPRSISKIKDIIKSIKILRKYKNNNNYNLVHCHSPIGGVITRYVFRQDKNTHIIYTAHGFHFYKNSPLINWLLFYPIEKLFSKYTDTLITINKEDYELAKKFKARKVLYVPGVGVDTNQIYNLKSDAQEKSAEFGFKKDDVVLFSAGQLSKRKNHEVIIKAISKLKNDNIKYLLCGFGELDNYLKDLVKKLNLESNVIFAGFRKDVKELLHTADIFVFPSLQEGLPVALMEAMAAGLPIVCSEIRGNVDLLLHEEGGFLAKPDNVDKFAKYINKLTTDKSLRKKMGQINLDKIVSYDINTISKHMEKLYSEI